MEKHRFSGTREAGVVIGEMAIVVMLLFSALIAVCVMGVFMFREAQTKNAANDLLRVAEGKIGLWVRDPKGADREEYREAFKELIREFESQINVGLHAVKLISYVYEDGRIAPFAFLPPGQCARELSSGRLVCNSHMCGSLEGGFGNVDNPECQVTVCKEGPDEHYKVIPCSELRSATEYGFKLCSTAEERTGSLCERPYDDDMSYQEKLEQFPIEVRLTFEGMPWLRLPGTSGIHRSAIATGFPRILVREESTVNITPPSPPPNCYPWTRVKAACDTNCGPSYMVTDTTRCDYSFCCDPRPEDLTTLCERTPCCAPWTEVQESCERACDGGHWMTQSWSCTPGQDEPCCEATRPESKTEWCPGYPDWEVGDWSECSAACGMQGTRTRTVTCSDVMCCGTEPARSEVCAGLPCQECSYIYQLWGIYDGNENPDVARVEDGRDEEPQCVADFLMNSRRCQVSEHSDHSFYLNVTDNEITFVDSDHGGGHGVEGYHKYENCAYTTWKDYVECPRSCRRDPACFNATPSCWLIEATDIAEFLGAPPPVGLPAICYDHKMSSNQESVKCSFTWYFDEGCNAVTGEPERICGVFNHQMCPISLVFGEDGSLVADGKVVNFNLDPTKDAKWSVWKAGEKSPLIVYDPEHNGKIDNAYQLFGNYAFGGKISNLKDARLLKTDKPHREPWKDGYEALGLLDKNGNGEVSGSELDSIGLWFDKNSNAVSEPGEVVKASEKGITTIYYREGKKTDDGIVTEKGYRLEQSGATKIGKSVDWYGEVYRSKHDAQAALMNEALGKAKLPDPEASKEVSNEAKISESAMVSVEIPNLSGFWVWNILENDGEKRPGVFALNDREGEITGWSVVDLPIKNKAGKAMTARTMLPLEGRRISNNKGNQLLSLNVWNKERTSFATSKAAVSKDGKMLRGISEQRVQGDKGQVTTLKYDWFATRVENKK